MSLRESADRQVEGGPADDRRVAHDVAIHRSPSTSPTRARRGDRRPAAQHDRRRRPRGDLARDRGPRRGPVDPRRLQRLIPDRAIARPRRVGVIIPMVNNADEAARGCPRIPLPAARRPVRGCGPLAVLHGRRHAAGARAGRVHRDGRDGRGPAQRRRDRRDARRRLRSTSARATSRSGLGLDWDDSTLERVPGEAPCRCRGERCSPAAKKHGIAAGYPRR